MDDYPFVVVAEDGGYFAEVPDLEKCSAFGRSPEEALAGLEIAKTVWLELARALGQPIPAPTVWPA